MDALTDTFRECKICHKACVAAVDMLAVRILFREISSVKVYELIMLQLGIPVQV